LESEEVFTGCQPQYPDLKMNFTLDFKGPQAAFDTTRHAPALIRHLPAADTVIEEIVESFVEGFTGWNPPLISRCTPSS